MIEEEVKGEIISKIFEVHCNQEKMVIGKLVKEDNKPLTVDAFAFLRSWKPAGDSFRFIRRPKEGDILRCPRCNGMLSIEGSCSLKGEKLADNPDGLIIGQFTIE